MVARRKWYGRDTGLTLRMAFTMFLLAALYLAFMAFLWHTTGSLLIVGLFGVVMALFQYFASDKLVLLSTGAHEVSAAEAPELYGIVERLCQLADLPRPRIAIMNTPMPNAFATGLSPKQATVCVTTGLLNTLDRPELEAVLGHELSHIKNRDMMIITFASLFATMASFIVQTGMWFGFGGFDGRGRRDGNAVVMAYLVSLLVWVVSFFLLRALSRYREYAADRGAAILTGAPSQLSSALLKIEQSMGMRRIPTQDLRQAQTMSAFYIMPVVGRDSIAELFSTHPTLEHRLARLRQLEQGMERV
jgi:heat shock protein HtpX